MAAGTAANAQLRFANSLSLTGGAFAASGLGTNAYLGLRYNYYFFGGRAFVEGAVGFGSLRSQVLEQVTQAQLFESEQLLTYEFVAGYDAFPSGPLPYLTLGVAGLNQGGQSKFAGSVGLGKRIPLSGMLGWQQVGLRYDIRDLIMSQSVNNSETFLTHNLALTLGIQFYF
jgi:hypothetical protein